MKIVVYSTQPNTPYGPEILPVTAEQRPEVKKKIYKCVFLEGLSMYRGIDRISTLRIKINELCHKTRA